MGSLPVSHFARGPLRICQSSLGKLPCGDPWGTAQGSQWVWHFRVGNDALPLSQHGFLSQLSSADPRPWP